MTLPRHTRWYEELPEVTVEVDCGGAPHRVTWRRGKLVLADHDLSAERAMLVFGGEPCPCLRVLKMWGDQFAMAPEQFALMRKWLGPNAFLAPEELDPIRRLAMILSWERAWRKGAYLSKHERLLDAELQERALPELRRHLDEWRGRVGARVTSRAAVRIVRSDRTPHLNGAMNSVSVTATATLAGDWPAEVGARGIATVGDAFVLEVTDSRRGALAVRAVRWEEQPGGALLPVEGLARAAPDSAGRWALEWEPESGEGSPGSARSGPSGSGHDDGSEPLVDFDPSKGWAS